MGRAGEYDEREAQRVAAGRAATSPRRRPRGDDDEDVAALPRTPVRFTAHFFWRFRWWYALIIILEVGAAVSSIVMPYAIGQIVGAVTQWAGEAGAQRDIGAAVSGPLVLFVALAIGEVVFNRASGACRVYVSPRQRTGIARAMFDYLQRHSQHYFSNHFAGALSARIAETSVGVNMTLSTVIFEFLPLAITLAVSIFLLSSASLVLASFTLAWSAVFILVSYWMARRAQPYAEKHAAARSATSGRIVDTVTNLANVRLFARGDYEREQLAAVQGREIAVASRAMWFSEKVQWFQMGAALVLKVGMLYFALTLWRDGRIDVAAFVMSTSLSLLVINDARNLGRRFLEVFEYVGNIANGVRTIMQPYEIVDRPGARDVVIRRGDIAFENVTFGYDSERPVFRDLDLVIPAGQRVGLVGFSGSGKSTLVNLLLRLYEPQQGRIMIDGVDIRDMTQDALHRQIGLIPQDPSLFHRSLADNIRYGRPEASLEDIRAAARGASADGFISEMPLQYDALVGERGVKLSGGQRQRVAIARVILKNAPILVLDEATSALDSITERVIQDCLDTVMQGRTVIAIAHRLSTIAHLDRILVFDHGTLVQDGSHDALLAQPGTYQRLWRQQAGGFLPTS
ncbi:ABC transporter ATP-binding protein [Verticiella sediminum]|uniref:ABC transporter ATP-binding protein n=1 Tax=Verticiella sediminum TaxID=1247510 RepID=A0A556AMT5_9BURK|nr:ABC transporter ATP-binding protein [Verticiella sediminum]TSH94199.1 ABC transporter ATP-binding protein [Verticiella sediminum]